ncbi:MAG: hypothetical protein M3R17_06740 [Bacteroidota bacterium]|nr:hypothetical protein [Bacteroidota bacterium]
MKRLLYAAVLLTFFTACRHQKSVASADANAYSKPPAPDATATPGSTVTTTQGDVQIQTDESTTATIVVYNPPDSVVTTVVAPAADTAQNIYRLTISFISKGEGIDYKTQESFEKWLKEQPKHPAYEVTHWGREGETNYCLKLNELSTREQEIFVRDVRTQLTDKSLVFVSEYAMCKGTK